MDGSGNVFVADYDGTAVTEIPLATPPSLSFAGTQVGIASSDSPQTVTVENIGNAPLTFPVPGTGNNPSIGADFQLDSSTSCPQLSSSSSAGSLGAGASCVLAVDFLPTQAGSPLSESLLLTDNHLNAAAPAYATQTIGLSGTAIQITLAPTTLSAATYGASYSVTLGGSGGTGPYTFSMSGGALPPGLSLAGGSGGGVLSGTPTSAGTYTFTIKATDSLGYTGIQDYTATVNPALLTVSVNSASRAYGTANPSFTGTVTSGLAPSDTVSSIGLTYATTATANSTIGQYPITASITSTNYTLSATPGTLTVSPAPLSVSVNNATRVYGTANPSFTGTVVSGLVGSDTASSIGLTYTTTATANSTAGQYPITVGITSANYALNVTEGSLTITQAASSTTLNVSSTSATPGQSVTLTATVASTTTGTPTGTVSFYDGTTLLGPATLSGGVATYTTTSLSAGATNSLTAVYSGDQNFTGSNSSAAVSVAVQPDQFTMTIMHQSVVTVDPGTSAAFEVQLTPNYGSDAGPVSFTATGLPPGATATFSPSLIAANAGPQVVTIIIGVPATTAANQSAQTARRLAPFSLALLLLPFAGSLRRRGRSMIMLLCLLVAFAGIAGLTGCGGSVQKQQSYDVTVTATAGSLTQTATFIINVD